MFAAPTEARLANVVCCSRDDLNNYAFLIYLLDPYNFDTDHEKRIIKEKKHDIFFCVF